MSLMVNPSWSFGDKTFPTAGQPLVVKGLRKARNVPPQAAGCYMLPLEYSATSEEPVVRAANLQNTNV